MRYSRLEMLEGIGPEGIEKLNKAKVLIIGCGALGSLCAMYLGASGVGTIGIADFDTIEISNLQRQLFFDESQLGKSKVETLAPRLKAINSETVVNVYNEFLTKNKVEKYFYDYDFIIDGSDNPATKSLTANVCEKLGKPYCIGGVKEFSGQVMSWSKGHAGYMDLFGDIPQCSGFTPCSVSGVLGPAAGIVASVQASEAIKHLTGAGKMLYDSIFLFDLYSIQASVLSF